MGKKMAWFFKDNEYWANLKDFDSKQLMYRVMPQLVAEIMSRYFRIRIEGSEHIPKSGAAIIAPNHSGYSGFDALLLGHHIHKKSKRVPRVLTHKLWFQSKTTAKIMKKMGFIEASRKNGLKALTKNQLLVLFPEGEYGNFKPSNKAYHLQAFKKGFIRMALEKQCPIIPTLILGAEETHINLARLKLGRRFKNMVIPLPLNIIPLPAKWHIIFMEPIVLPYSPLQADDTELIEELISEIREKMQARLSHEVSQRKNLYF